MARRFNGFSQSNPGNKGPSIPNGVFGKCTTHHFAGNIPGFLSPGGTAHEGAVSCSLAARQRVSRTGARGPADGAARAAAARQAALPVPGPGPALAGLPRGLVPLAHGRRLARALRPGLPRRGQQGAGAAEKDRHPENIRKIHLNLPAPGACPPGRSETPRSKRAGSGKQRRPRTISSCRTPGAWRWRPPCTACREGRRP